MRLIASRSPLLAAAAMLLAAAQPASSQNAATPTPVRPVAYDGGATTRSAFRTVAVYRFNRSNVAGIPSEVTLADSAGQLVAWFRLPGTRAARPMAVSLIGDDIVLQGETPVGVLTLQVREEIDARAGNVLGRWRLEGREGELRGRTQR